MSIEEIKGLIEQQGKAFEEYKSTNDANAKQRDVLNEEKLKRLDTALDNIAEVKQKLALVEAAASRTLKGGDEVKAATEVAAAEYAGAFKSYICRGADDGLNVKAGAAYGLEGKALSVFSDPDGGYLVTPQMSAVITKAINESSPIRALASVETITSDSLDIINDVNLASAGWVGEQASRPDTNTPQIGKSNITAHEMYAQPKATQKLLDDAGINVEAWLADKIAEKFGLLEATAFVSGTGVAQPRGFLTYANGTAWGQVEQVTSGSSGAVTADGLISLMYALKEAYQANAAFLANRAVVSAVRKLKDSTNQYLWQPGLAAGAPDILLGKPVYMAADMPTAAANSLSVAVADWRRAYQIVDRIGIRTLRDPYTDKPFVKFYTTKRVGGDVVNFEAVKLLKLA